MMRVMGACALAAMAMSGVATAQEGEYRDPKQVTGPDVETIREGIASVGQAGECMVTFTVGLDGKPKDMVPECTPEAYAPIALKAMATVEYLPELFDGEVFETEGMKQPFQFGVTQSAPAVSAPGDTPPVATREIAARDVSRAMNKVDKVGACDLVYTVGANGRAKDIQPNCTPAEYDEHIIPAVEKMRFKPGEKDGKPIDWPGVQQPLALGSQD